MAYFCKVCVGGKICSLDEGHSGPHRTYGGVPFAVRPLSAADVVAETLAWAEAEHPEAKYAAAFGRLEVQFARLARGETDVLLEEVPVVDDEVAA